ncbi:MAG: preprotein translocase subunit YajC, partial [Nitrosomonas sp.]|nr:preprotein translocase subunit YajC [Nitrosomonas sp.]
MLINDAFAQAASSTQAGADWLSLLPMLGILVIFYLLLIRPQAKRAKEQKQMVEALQRGDEVITNGGILGLIINVSENYVVIEVAPTVEITVLKSSVQTLLP